VKYPISASKVDGFRTKSITYIHNMTRKQILNTRIKVRWVICNVGDYIHANR